jgi:hypothetical protein
MTNLNLPKISPKNSSTKDNIIKILSQKQPIGAKGIHHKLKREYAATTSYQATHKTLGEMVKEETLEKSDEGYKINKEWIDNLKNFSNSFDYNRVDLENLNSLMITFSNFIDFGKFLVNEFFNFPNEKNKDSTCVWKHHYPMIGASNTEHINMKKTMERTTHYGICQNNTFLDKYFGRYTSKLGKKNVYNTKVLIRDDVFVTGDFILQAMFDPEYYQKLQKMYKITKSEKDIDLPKIFEIMSTKTEIIIFINKNPELAEVLRRKSKHKHDEKSS